MVHGRGAAPERKHKPCLWSGGRSSERKCALMLACTFGKPTSATAPSGGVLSSLGKVCILQQLDTDSLVNLGITARVHGCVS